MKRHLFILLALLFAAPSFAQNPRQNVFGTAATREWGQALAGDVFGIPRYTTALLPTCTAARLGAFAYDTTASSVKVCNGTWGAIGGGGSSAFSALTGSTNSTAAMIVGTGASLTTSGSGTITATTAAALAANGANCSAGNYPLGVDAAGAVEGCTAVPAAGANTALSNLAAVAINAALIPNSAAGFDFGSATLPWKDIWFAGTSGTPGTNNFKITGASTAGLRTITFPDASISVARTDAAQTFTGTQAFSGSVTVAGSIGLSGTGSTPAGAGFYSASSPTDVSVALSGARKYIFNANGLFLFSDTEALIFGASTDTGVSRAAAGRVQISGGTPGTTAGQLELVLDANGSRVTHFQTTELLTLSIAGTTTDTTANLLPANSIIDACVARITTTITTATSWQLGDPTTAGRFTAANATMVAGTTDVGLLHMAGNVTTVAAGPTQAAAAKVRVTTVGTPGAGIIRITCTGRTFTPPTS